MKQDSRSSSYKPIVAIKDVEDFRPLGDHTVRGDRRDGCFYRYNPRIKLAVNVAMATGRPLLVLGATGCGKSSLAHNLARIMNRRYYEYVVTSRSQARDLFYRFDAIRRLGDSQSGNLLKPVPGESVPPEIFHGRPHSLILSQDQFGGFSILILLQDADIQVTESFRLRLLLTLFSGSLIRVHHNVVPYS